MIKILQKLFITIVITICLSSITLEARKAALEGFGKISKTGRIKSKITRGYLKKSGIYVNSYAHS